MNDNDTVMVFIAVIILFLFIGGCGGGCYYYSSKKCCDDFTNIESSSGYSSPLYNSLYTSPESGYIYTQPPGDVKAQEFAGSGQGTSGEFFPIQGRAAGTFMKNSANSNLSLPSLDEGVIGGQPNYTEQTFSSRWIGFNNFGSPFSDQNTYSDSYLIDGGNQRVLNSGQKGDLPAQDWFPIVQKDSMGFATQASDAMVPYGTLSVNKSPGGRRFLKSKMSPRWKTVIN